MLNNAAFLLPTFFVPRQYLNNILSRLNAGLVSLAKEAAESSQAESSKKRAALQAPVNDAPSPAEGGKRSQKRSKTKAVESSLEEPSLIRLPRSKVGTSFFSIR